MAVYNERQKIVLGPTLDVAAGTGAVWGERVPGPPGAKYEVESVHLHPDVAIVANGANFSTYSLVNATTGATIATRAYSAVNSVGNVPEALPIAAAGREVSAGDVLTWTKAESGTGLAGRPRAVVVLRRIS